MYLLYATLIDDANVILDYSVNLITHDGCSPSEIPICVAMVELEILAHSCFENTGLDLYLVFESRQKPFYRSSNYHRFEMALNSQCIVVKIIFLCICSQNDMCDLCK